MLWKKKKIMPLSTKWFEHWNDCEITLKTSLISSWSNSFMSSTHFLCVCDLVASLCVTHHIRMCEGLCLVPVYLIGVTHLKCFLEPSKLQACVLQKGQFTSLPGSRGPSIPLKGIPNDLKASHEAPPLKVSTSFQQLGTKPLTHETLGPVLDLTNNSRKQMKKRRVKVSCSGGRDL